MTRTEANDGFEISWRSTRTTSAGSFNALTEDFESVTQPALPAGWTTENPNGGFEFITADASTSNTGGFWPITEHTQFAIANDDACNCDMSEVRLISPAFPLQNAARVVLEAWVWLDNVYGSDPFERGTVEINSDGDGTGWAEVFEIPPVAAWQKIVVDLSDHRGGPNARIAFRFNDNGNWGRGLAVDDVVVRVTPFFDLPSFSQNFQAPTPPALPAGWSSVNANGPTLFTTGGSDDANGGFWPIDEHGVFAFISDDACNCDLSQVRLISPQFAIEPAGRSVLEAWVWLDNVYGSDPFERGTVEIDPNGDGVGWFELFEIPPLPAWQQIHLDLSAFAGLSNARIAFRYNDNGNWGRGLAVDDVAIRQPTAFEDFESVVLPNLPSGWTTENLNGGDLFTTSDAATVGASGFWPITEHTQFAVADDDACNCDMSEVRLISPLLDLPNSSGILLDAWVWLDNVYGSDPFERGTVEIDLNGDGAGWLEVEAFTPLEAWQRVLVNLSPYRNHSTARIAFRFDDNGNWGRGLAVDDIMLFAVGEEILFGDSFETGDVSGWTSSAP